MRFRPASKAKRFRAIPKLESLNDRVLPSVTFIEKGDTLVIRGDNQANNIVINDNGTSVAGNVTVLADGQSYTATGSIATIRVLTRGGNDSVQYDLSSDLWGARNVIADLGNGADSFVANLQTNINDPAALAMRVWGGNGNDLLTLNAVGANVGVGGSLKVGFQGGNGKDTLDMNFSGILNGDAIFNADGGNGKDVVTGHLNAESSELQETGETWPSTGTLVAHFRGGNGVDAMTLQVTGTDDLTKFVARANGGNGKDTFDVSENVKIVDPNGKKK